MVKRFIVFISIFFSFVKADYYFEVPKNYSRVYINKDGSVDIKYDIVFKNTYSGQAIDIVDVGMPNSHYKLSTARAFVNGEEVEGDIRPSEYVKPGVEVHLENLSIDSGEEGEFKFYIQVDHMVYEDSEDKEYASVEFSPTWFGSEFCTGETDLKCEFYFPKGVKPGEPRYHKLAFTDAYAFNNSVVYVWQNQHALPYKQYLFGASFPKKYVDKVYKGPGFFEQLGKLLSGLFSCVCSGFPFIILGFFLLMAMISGIKKSIAKRHYLPPSITMEGGGIKRGLTAPEAALLIEKPLEQVASLILFGLIKKGIIEIVSQKPLRIKKTQNEKMSPLRYYEKELLNGLKKIDAKEEVLYEIDKKKFSDVFVLMIKVLKDKMKNFSRSKTIEYYKNIIARAWKQLKAANSPEIASEELAKNVDWLMLDKGFKEKMPVALPYNIRMPFWYYTNFSRSKVNYSSGNAPSFKFPSGGFHFPSLPGADIANNIVSGIENTANSIVSMIPGFHTSVARVTNPDAFKSSSYSSSSHGGGSSSCACACACAGCACACAGGGR